MAKRTYFNVQAGDQSVFRMSKQISPVCGWIHLVSLSFFFCVSFLPYFEVYVGVKNRSHELDVGRMGWVIGRKLNG